MNSRNSESTGSKRSRTPTGIGEIVGDFFAPPERQRKLRAYRLWQFWNEVVGPQIAAHAHPLRIRDTVLEVRVDQPIWMQQLQLLKPQIIERLNAQLGEKLIEDLFFRRGRLEPAKSATPRISRELPQLADAERDRINALVADIESDEVRRELERLLQLQARLAKYRDTPA